MSKNKNQAPTLSVEERQTMRFDSDENNLARIDLNIESEAFSPTINALVVDESHQGCGLVTLDNDDLFEGRTITLGVGRLTPLHATIEWCQQPTEQILLLGCKYLE